jgi:hypothetical protein
MCEALEFSEVSLYGFYLTLLRQCGHPHANFLKVPDDDPILFVLVCCFLHLFAHLLAERTPLLVMQLRFPHYLLRGMRVPALALLRTLITIVALSCEGGAGGNLAEIDCTISLARALLHLFNLQSILQGADHLHIFYYLILCGI